ncbi:MAG: PKD domain-containing protein, partial [Bacteroidia bacterium]|nr:PKD domain-containing protein [Bacteroidia bacterium]
TLFSFDASGSSDNDDDISKLEVRWDWEADGVWDTDYSEVKTASHRFKDFGDNFVILGVKDTKGLTASLKKPVSITDAATITGMDPRMCVCCGGWWICIRQDTLRFYDAPAAALAILEKATFPLAVHVKWTKKDPRCMGDEIIVLEMIIN